MQVILECFGVKSCSDPTSGYFQEMELVQVGAVIEKKMDCWCARSLRASFPISRHAGANHSRPGTAKK